MGAREAKNLRPLARTSIWPLYNLVEEGKTVENKRRHDCFLLLEIALRQTRRLQQFKSKGSIILLQGFLLHQKLGPVTKAIGKQVTARKFIKKWG
jgi:hypothetical protein